MGALLSAAGRIAAVAVAVAAAAATATGCYRPDVRDCAVRCTGADACAGGQICGSDGFCAAPEVAGSCGQPADIDARVDGADATADAARLDAAVDAAVDATPLATLRILISGRGRVVAGTLGQCDGPSGDCSWDVEAGVMVDLVPVDTHPQDTFAGWSTANCAGETGACTVTIVAPQTLVGATFQ